MYSAHLIQINIFDILTVFGPLIINISHSSYSDYIWKMIKFLFVQTWGGQYQCLELYSCQFGPDMLTSENISVETKNWTVHWIQRLIGVQKIHKHSKDTKNTLQRMRKSNVYCQEGIYWSVWNDTFLVKSFPTTETQQSNLYFSWTKTIKLPFVN